MFAAYRVIKFGVLNCKVVIYKLEQTKSFEGVYAWKGKNVMVKMVVEELVQIGIWLNNFVA